MAVSTSTTQTISPDILWRSVRYCQQDNNVTPCHFAATTSISSEHQSASTKTSVSPSYATPSRPRMNIIDSNEYQPTKQPPTDATASALRACYELDETISNSTSLLATHDIALWQTIDPIVYLTSPTLVGHWKTALNSICQQFSTGILTPTMFEQKIKAILPGVEKLDEAKRDLEWEIIESEGETEILDKIWDAVDARCKVVESCFMDLVKKMNEEHS